MDLPNELPSGDYLEYFGPDFTLHPQVPAYIEYTCRCNNERPSVVIAH
jgi:hypothetical protein